MMNVVQKKIVYKKYIPNQALFNNDFVQSKILKDSTVNEPFVLNSELRVGETYPGLRINLSLAKYS